MSNLKFKNQDKLLLINDQCILYSGYKKLEERKNFNYYHEKNIKRTIIGLIPASLINEFDHFFQIS